MAQFKMQATKPDNIEFTLTATLTLHQWKALDAQLHQGAGSAPGNALQVAIRHCIFRADQTFKPEDMEHE